MKKFILPAAALLASSLALGADAPAPTALDRLNVFAGTWKSDIQNFKTPYSEESSGSSTLVNQCWKTGAFFVCNQSVDGVSRTMLVFSFKGGDTYKEVAVSAESGVGSNGILLIDGGVWTFPAESHKYGQVTYFRTVNIYSGNDSLDFREEYSTDQQTWTLMSKGHETRVRN
ncbi:MAG TPA: hypothetical protein VGM16_04495 [Gammaproteobacteria bacterium]|jgi:hypothetical protein